MTYGHGNTCMVTPHGGSVAGPPGGAGGFGAMRAFLLAPLLLLGCLEAGAQPAKFDPSPTRCAKYERGTKTIFVGKSMMRVPYEHCLKWEAVDGGSSTAHPR